MSATYRNCCCASGEKPRPAAELFDGPARLMNTCVRYLPSGVNTCTRRFDRSATYTSPSFEILIACTGLLNVSAPGPSVSSCGGAGGPPADTEGGALSGAW